MPRLEACNTGDLEAEGMHRFDPPGRPPIAIFKLDGEYYATDDTCTHGQASLAEGFIEDGSIYCPFHEGAFDLKTGKASAPPCVVGVKTYPVVVEGEQIFVEID
jgi:nitrite reductase/ring-hydroxylating ferredoxin subunit